jgi:hypothetical protein
MTPKHSLVNIDTFPVTSQSACRFLFPQGKIKIPIRIFARIKCASVSIELIGKLDFPSRQRASWRYLARASKPTTNFIFFPSDDIFSIADCGVSGSIRPCRKLWSIGRDPRHSGPTQSALCFVAITFFTKVLHENGYGQQRRASITWFDR